MLGRCIDRNTRLISISETSMDTVTISPRYQVAIPKYIRERLDLRPGQKVEAILYDCRIELVPVRPISEMQGFLPGLESDVPREADRV